jgi:hypothetical protein
MLPNATDCDTFELKVADTVMLRLVFCALFWGLVLDSVNGGSVTLTVQLADNPLAVRTVTVAEPRLSPLTTPLELTLATELLLDDQDSVVVALDGVTLELSVTVEPTFTVT